MANPYEFAFGFADYASLHPEVGSPISAEVPARANIQHTTTGTMVYIESTNQVTFAPFNPDPSTPPTPSQLLYAIDISNYQSSTSVESLVNNLPEPVTRVIVRTPIPGYEQDHLPAIALDQIAQARALGLDTQCYMWIYPTQSIPAHAQAVDALLRQSPYYNELTAIWMDVEESMPDSCAQPLRDAVSYLQSLNWQVGIYTGKYIWPSHWTSFNDLPLWIANYDSSLSLNTVPLPPSWSNPPTGWQFTSDPIDRNQFNS